MNTDEQKQKALILEYTELALKSVGKNKERLDEIKALLDMSHSEIIEASAKQLVG